MGDTPPEAQDSSSRELMEHRTNLFAFVLSIVRDFDVAEEVLQDAAAAAGPPAGASLGAWVRLARSKLPRDVSLSREAVDALERAVEAVSPADWLEAVRQYRESLSGQTRSMLRMRYRDGMSGAQISRRTKHPVSAVHQRLGRARAMLADRVRSRPGGGNGP